MFVHASAELLLNFVEHVNPIIEEHKKLPSRNSRSGVARPPNPAHKAIQDTIEVMMESMNEDFLKFKQSFIDLRIYFNDSLRSASERHFGTSTCAFFTDNAILETFNFQGHSAPTTVRPFP